MYIDDNNNNNDFRLCHFIHYTDDPESKGLLLPINHIKWMMLMIYFALWPLIGEKSGILNISSFGLEQVRKFNEITILIRDCILKRDFITNSVKRNEVNKE